MMKTEFFHQVPCPQHLNPHIAELEQHKDSFQDISQNLVRPNQDLMAKKRLQKTSARLLY